MTTFEEDLAAAQAPSDDHIDVLVLINSKPHLFRFRQMDGMAWAAETDRHPPRPNVAVDAAYGYNIRSLTKGAAPQCGVLVVDGEERKLRVDPPVKPKRGEKVTKRVDQWEQVFQALSGHDFKRITDAIWSLNEYLPEKAVKAAGKALASSGSTSL
jgi:hypothetical protein